VSVQIKVLLSHYVIGKGPDLLTDCTSTTPLWCSNITVRIY